MYRSLIVVLFAAVMAACSALPAPRPAQQAAPTAPAREQSVRPVLLTAAAHSASSATATRSQRIDDLRYRLREQQARALEQFRGGDKVVVVSVTTGAAILLAVVLLIILV